MAAKCPIYPSEIEHHDPVTVNLIGAGFTSGQFLTALARINYAQIVLGHAGTFDRAFDYDAFDNANRQAVVYRGLAQTGFAFMKIIYGCILFNRRSFEPE